MKLTEVILSFCLAFTSSCYYNPVIKEPVQVTYTDEELAPKEWDTPDNPGYYFSPTWFKDHPQSCVKEVYDQEFTKEVLENDKPVIVYFTTGGCPGCEKMAPILYRTCEAYPEIKFVASTGSLKEKYNLNDFYPQVSFFNKGKHKKEFDFNIGYRKPFEQRIDKFLKGVGRD